MPAGRSTVAPQHPLAAVARRHSTDVATGRAHAAESVAARHAAARHASGHAACRAVDTGVHAADVRRHEHAALRARAGRAPPHAPWHGAHAATGGPAKEVVSSARELGAYTGPAPDGYTATPRHVRGAEEAPRQHPALPAGLSQSDAKSSWRAHPHPAWHEDANAATRRNARHATRHATRCCFQPAAADDKTARHGHATRKSAACHEHAAWRPAGWRRHASWKSDSRHEYAAR